MSHRNLEFPPEKLFVVDFIVEDESTTDKDLIIYYYQLIEGSIPASTRENILCKSFIQTFEAIINKAKKTEDKKRIFVQYYQVLVADAAYRSLMQKVNYYLY